MSIKLYKLPKTCPSIKQFKRIKRSQCIILFQYLFNDDVHSIYNYEQRDQIITNLFRTDEFYDHPEHHLSLLKGCINTINYMNDLVPTIYSKIEHLFIDYPDANIKNISYVLLYYPATIIDLINGLLIGEDLLEYDFNINKHMYERLRSNYNLLAIPTTPTQLWSQHYNTFDKMLIAFENSLDKQKIILYVL